MGHGIAQVAAQSGFATSLFDPIPEALERGLARAREGFSAGVAKGKLTADEARDASERLTAANSLAEAVAGAELVLEAGPENLALKVEILRAACAAAPEGAVIASNTSSLSLTDLAAATPRPAQVVGMH